MSIQELWLKFKSVLKNTEFLLSFLIIAVSLISFFLGRYSVLENGSKQGTVRVQPMLNEAAVVRTASSTKQSSTEVQSAQNQTEDGYVASKSGTKYHLPWCAGAKQIKEANKIWFKTKTEAEAAGYEPASNCKGI